jgi:hypothetical protein
VAGTYDAWIIFLSFLLSGFPEGESLGAEEEARELCTIGITEAKDPLVKGAFSPLDGTKSQAPLSLGFVLLLNLPKPCRVLRPAFLILSATRKNSLSLEICRSSDFEWIFIFTIEYRSRIHQEKCIFVSRTMFLSDMCSGSEPRDTTSATSRRVNPLQGGGATAPSIIREIEKVQGGK